MREPLRRLARRRAVGMLVAALLALGSPRAFAAAPGPAAPDAAPAAAAGEAGGAPGAAAPPAPIPLPEVAAQAEAVASWVRGLQDSLQAGAPSTTLPGTLPELEREIDQRKAFTERALDEGARSAALDYLATSWDELRQTVSATADALTAEAVGLEQRLDEISSRRARWARTLEDARAAKAPAAVLERIQDTLDLLRDARKPLEARRAQVLLLQERVTRALATCDGELQAIADYRKQILGRLGRRTAQPLWRLDRAGKGLGSVVERVAEASRREWQVLGRFLAARGPGVLGTELACFAVFAFLFRSARRRSRRWDGAELGEAAQVFSRPYASALILAIFVVRLLFRGSPRIYDQIVWVLAGAAALRLAWVLLEPSLRLLLVATAVSFLWDRVRELASPIPLLEQLLFVAQMLAGVGFLAVVMRPLHLERLAGSAALSAWRRRLAVSLRVVLTAFALSAVAGATGYLELAYLVGEATLFALYLGLVLYAVRSAADGLVSFALHVWPLSRLRMVERHPGLIQARTTRAISVAALVAWVAGTLARLGLLEPLLELGRTALALPVTPFRVGITLGDGVAFGLTLWAAFLVSRFVRFALEEDVYHRLQLARGVPYAVSNLVQYGVLLIGFLVALLTLGLDVNRFTVLAGAFGVGIGFGLQNIVNNFVSGLILLFERPIQVGDAVQLGELTGEVTRIGIRSSTLRTWEGAEVILPNASLIQDRVTNWTLSDRTRRFDISIGAAYGSDPERVLAVLMEAARQDRRVLASPAPVALFMGFGASALDFQLRVWTDDPEWPLVRSELAIAVYRAFRASGIEIPFPQQDVRLTVEKG